MKTRGFSYRRVIKRRDAVFGRAMRPYMEARLTGATIGDLTDDILAEMPPTVSRDALFESLRLFAGTQLSRRTGFEIAWRLAGNLDRLIAGEPVLPWNRQIANEVVPVRVEHMRPHKRFDNPGYLLHCRALAGSSCPLVFPNFFSRRSCFGIANTIGFSAPWGLYPYQHPMYFVNLMFFAHIEAEKSHEYPVFSEVSCNTSLKLENKAKIEVRTRARPCPRGFKHECNKCPIGYNECPAGIYPRTLVSRYCARCQQDAFFEPDDEEQQDCINCRHTPTPTEKV
jgi:hypothetical protein